MYTLVNTMKGSCFLVAFAFLVVVLAVVSAHDPSQIQDFCVAVNNVKHGVIVNGKFCKDPKLVKPDDFFVAGLDKPGNISNPAGSKVNPISVDKLPGLNTLGISLIRIDFAPNGGQNPPHTHPRATEVLTVLDGTLKVGFITTAPSYKHFTKVINKGDVFVFPVGLVHYQVNIGKTPAVAMAGLSSQNPGLIAVAKTVFGSSPRVDSDVLSNAFQIDEKEVKNLQSKFS